MSSWTRQALPRQRTCLNMQTWRVRFHPCRSGTPPGPITQDVQSVRRNTRGCADGATNDAALCRFGARPRANAVLVGLLRRSRAGCPRCLRRHDSDVTGSVIGPWRSSTTRQCPPAGPRARWTDLAENGPGSVAARVVTFARCCFRSRPRSRTCAMVASGLANRAGSVMRARRRTSMVDPLAAIRRVKSSVQENTMP